MGDTPPPGHALRFTTIAHGDTDILGPLLPADLDLLAGTTLAALGHDGGGAPVALDIGCGKGDLLVRFALHGVLGIGLDRNPWFIADARRLAATAGVADRLEWRTADADAESLPSGVHVAACIGAAGAIGGPIQTPAVLAGLLRAGGLALVGELFWRIPPPPDAAAAFGMVAGEVVDLDATVARVTAGGLELVAVVQASQAGWDAYEDAYAGAVERWVAAHPDDPDRVRLRAGAQMMRESWTTWRRTAMGFAVIVARRPSR